MIDADERGIKLNCCSVGYDKLLNTKVVVNSRPERRGGRENQHLMSILLFTLTRTPILVPGLPFPFMPRHRFDAYHFETRPSHHRTVL